MNIEELNWVKNVFINPNEKYYDLLIEELEQKNAQKIKDDERLSFLNTVLSFFDELHSIVELREEELTPVRKDTNSEKRKALLSYDWLGKQEEINDLFLKMKVFLSEETNEIHFTNVFSRKHVNEIEPVRWHDDCPSEVIYFLKTLIGEGLVEKLNKTNRFNYQLLKKCFVKPNGDEFVGHLKSLKSNIDYDLSASTRESLDKIIQEFI